MYSFSILLSCMHETDSSIIELSNIKTNAVIINQCDKETVKTWRIGKNEITWVDTCERGLSNSRNMAIKYADADICLIADNDEVFDDDCKDKIMQAYEQIPDADIIIFNLHNKSTKLKNKTYRLRRMEMQRVVSWQITFKRESLLKSGISFDPKLGAGTGNGAGEENKLLYDCYDKGLKIYHVPVNIGYMRENESTWFQGFDAEFFYKHGMVTRYTLGLKMSLIYAGYYLITKYSLYRSTISPIGAGKSLFRGIFENKLNKI